ncbi:MAG: hypothetical protein IPK82_25550 [Polyangiaceae bacterium]|nr:hypothetical protein [Polyangiaceae bacterium]
MEPKSTQPSDANSDSARLAELARGATSALALYSEAGDLLVQNAVAAAAFGGSSLAALLGSPARAERIVAAVRRDGSVRQEIDLVTKAGNVWFLVVATLSTDPVTDQPAISIFADDITERRSAERAKDELISVVSHELRTPLTAIRGAVGLLGNSVVEDEGERNELFEIVWENVLRLGRLVDDLLDVQRLRLGAVELVVANIDITPLVRETVDLLINTSLESAVSLVVEEPAPSIFVRADPGRIVQALSNLVTNAVKHSPPNTAVRVSVTKRVGFVRVSVRDEGPGVPDAFVPRLFAPFSQADSTDARLFGGAGLGLYIVRTLIGAHGGTVGYERAPDRGSIFFFDLPSEP